MVASVTLQFQNRFAPRAAGWYRCHRGRSRTSRDMRGQQLKSRFGGAFFLSPSPPWGEGLGVRGDSSWGSVTVAPHPRPHNPKGARGAERNLVSRQTTNRRPHRLPAIGDSLCPWLSSASFRFSPPASIPPRGYPPCRCEFVAACCSSRVRLLPLSFPQPIQRRRACRGSSGSTQHR